MFCSGSTSSHSHIFFSRFCFFLSFRSHSVSLPSFPLMIPPIRRPSESAVVGGTDRTVETRGIRRWHCLTMPLVCGIIMRPSCGPHCASCPSVCLQYVCPVLTANTQSVEKQNLVWTLPVAEVTAVPIFASNIKSQRTWRTSTATAAYLAYIMYITRDGRLRGRLQTRPNLSEVTQFTANTWDARQLDGRPHIMSMMMKTPSGGAI